LTGSSAARLMLLSRMKKRMRFVKMLWLTILWHRTLNLKNEVGKNAFTSLVMIVIGHFLCDQIEMGTTRMEKYGQKQIDWVQSEERGRGGVKVRQKVPLTGWCG